MGFGREPVFFLRSQPPNSAAVLGFSFNHFVAQKQGRRGAETERFGILRLMTTSYWLDDSTGSRAGCAQQPRSTRTAMAHLAFGCGLVAPDFLSRTSGLRASEGQGCQPYPSTRVISRNVRRYDSNVILDLEVRPNS